MGDEVSDEEVVVVGVEPPKALSFSMKELDRQLAKKVGETSAQTGRGTPPTRQQMIDWLLSVDEKELARRHSKRREEEADWAEAFVSDATTEASKAAAGEKGKGSGGKGKGAGKSSTREREAEQRHVRRQEDGRSK